MHSLLMTVRRLFVSCDGPAAVEYAVLLAVIIVAAVGALSAFGVHMDAVYASINSTVPTGAGS